MATYYLDPDDEITKAAALIRGAGETRVSLVVPPGSRVATSRMNFRLLAREAQTRHRRLSIVAPDAASRALAASAGLPVFSTVAEQEAAEAQGAGAGNGHAAETAAALQELAATVDRAPRSDAGAASAAAKPDKTAPPVRRGDKSPSRANLPGEHRGPSLRVVAVALVAVLVLALSAYGAYLFVPSATVALTPRALPLTPLQLTVKIDPAAKTPDATNLVAPGISQNVPVQANGKFDATGQKVAETSASGIVTFTNYNNDHGLDVPAGTQVWTAAGVVFLTHAAVRVPPGTGTSSVTPGTVSVAVDAQRAGLSGNVPAGSIVNLPASLNAQQAGKLSVSNANATTGGTHTVTPLIQQSDVDAAKTALSSQLQQQFVQTIADPSKAPPSMKVFPDSSQLGAASFDPDPATLVGHAVDAASPKFELAATATGTVTAADLEAVRKLADARLRTTVPTGRSLVDDSIAIVVGDGVAVGSVINVPVTAAANTMPVLDLAALKQAIKGKSQGEAKRYLSQYGDVSLQMTPDWLPNLPGYDFRIDLRVVQPSPAPSPSSSPASPSPSPSRSPGPSSPAPEVT